MSPPATDLEALGGPERLEALIRAFVARMFQDMIIGFVFEGRDAERIIRHETEHAARLLGGRAPYTGRPLDVVHRPLGLNKGHFRRRLALLRDVLRRHDVDEGVIERWITADQRLESAITGSEDCVP